MAGLIERKYFNIAFYLFPLDFYWRIVDLQCCVVSDVLRNDPVTHIHIYSSCFRFFSHIGYHKILGRIPYAIQEVLGGNLSFI